MRLSSSFRALSKIVRAKNFNVCSSHVARLVPALGLKFSLRRVAQNIRLRFDNAVLGSRSWIFLFVSSLHSVYYMPLRAGLREKHCS